MTELADKMRDLADKGHQRADELFDRANALDVAAAGFYGVIQTVSTNVFIGTWSRAKLLWCDCSGEPLS